MIRSHWSMPILLSGALLIGSQAWADGPGRGRGQEPPERTQPGRGNAPTDPGNPSPGRPDTPPGSGVTPPGLGGNPPPGHGGPNPGLGNGSVLRGNTRVCGADAAPVIGPEGRAGASHVAHVEFSPADDDASLSWARMMYFWIGTSFDYVLNAHRLEPSSRWTLVARATDDSAICLGTAAANPGGELHLAATLDFDSHLPEDLDPFEPTPEGEAPEGATLELLPADGVDCTSGASGAEADSALVSDHAVRFVDVDEIVCPG